MLNIFNSNRELLIPNPSRFTSSYKISAKNNLIMGEENIPIETVTESIIDVEQIINSDGNIGTIISLKEINGSSSNESIKASLNQMLLISQISKKVIFERDKKGMVMSILNKEQLMNDWRIWKSNHIKEVFPKLEDQERFITNYEKGMYNLEQNILSSYHYYSILFPVFSFKRYADNHDTIVNSKIKSKLLADFNIHYRMKPIKITFNNSDFSDFSLKSEIINKEQMLLELKQNSTNDINLAKSYRFGIYLNGTLNKKSGEIIKSNFSYTEILHKNYRYDLLINSAKI